MLEVKQSIALYGDFIFYANEYTNRQYKGGLSQQLL